MSKSKYIISKPKYDELSSNKRYDVRSTRQYRKHLTDSAEINLLLSKTLFVSSRKKEGIGKFERGGQFPRHLSIIPFP